MIEINDAHQLKSMVEKWVNEFNFIQLHVIETMAQDQGIELFELIEQSTDYMEYIRNYNLEEEYEQYLIDEEMEDSEEMQQSFCEDQVGFDSWENEQQCQNYPAWNTLFEFKYEPTEEILNAARSAGFGIIQGLDYFNCLLFVTGAGYSFYSHHWIPMFLELPWCDGYKKQVEEKGINFNGM